MYKNVSRLPRIFLAAVITVLLVLMTVSPAFAQSTDEILNFIIKVDVNDDATLNMTYHIDWKVLDEDQYGKLEWINLGVPNYHHENIEPASDTIDYIYDEGDHLEIYLDRAYGENEIVSLEFTMTQDNMYQIDKYVTGETVYSFTPAWFDDIDVDNLTILWNADRAGAWQPDCYSDNGYLTFKTSYPYKYTIEVVYPNDAFGFSEEHQEGSDGGDDWDYDDDFGIFEAIGGFIALVIVVTPFVLVYKFIKWLIGGLGFGSGQRTQKKIIRTKITYYDNCPSCGAAREEGKEKCEYCGRSMIKSKEIVEEKEIKEP